MCDGKEETKCVCCDLQLLNLRTQMLQKMKHLTSIHKQNRQFRCCSVTSSPCVKLQLSTDVIGIVCVGGILCTYVTMS